VRETNTVKKTVRLRRVWDDMIKEYSRRTGLKQIEVIEKLLSYGNNQFREYYGLGEESDTATAMEKGDAVRCARHQVELKGEKLADAHMRSILFGDLDGTVRESENLMKLEPRTIWDRLTRKKDEWQSVE
jgi:hypothetical protein